MRISQCNFPFLIRYGQVVFYSIELVMITNWLTFSAILFVNFKMSIAYGRDLTTTNTYIFGETIRLNSYKWLYMKHRSTDHLTKELVTHNTDYKRSSFLSDSIVLQSYDTYCRGNNPILTVTGKSVKWYADANKKQLLYQGNTYQSAPLDQTTTFYLTQTIDGTESQVLPITIEIVEPYLVNITIIPASCGKNDGVISITATGGTTRNPLQYSINNGPLQTSPIFSNLSPGTYTVMDRIANCWGTKDVIVSAPPSPTITNITLVDPQCGNSNGTLTISASGGSGSISYSLNGVDFKTDNQFTNLAGGTYTVTVRDQDQCAVSKSVLLKKTVNLQLNQVDVFATTCGRSNGRITANSKEGNGRISYSIDGLTYQFSNTFDSLSSGVYTLSIQDEAGCRDTKSVSIDSSEGPTIAHIDAKPPTCGMADGQINITAIGARKLSYRLNGMAYQNDSSFDQLPVGHYDVSVKDDLGCIVQQPVTLGQPCEDAIYLPDAFTPNQDGINEGWVIFFPFASLQLDELTIFNRWGEVIFYSTPHVINSGDLLWNGMYKDQWQVGIYTYQLKIRLPNGKSHTYRGTVLLAL